MAKQQKVKLVDKIQAATAEAMKKLIAETKAKNAYLVYSDKNGKIVKVEAKDL